MKTVSYILCYFFHKLWMRVSLCSDPNAALIVAGCKKNITFWYFCIRRNFIKFVKQCLQPIRNYLGLLVNSAKVFYEHITRDVKMHSDVNWWAQSLSTCVRSLNILEKWLNQKNKTKGRQQKQETKGKKYNSVQTRMRRGTKAAKTVKKRAEQDRGQTDNKWRNTRGWTMSSVSVRGRNFLVEISNFLLLQAFQVHDAKSYKQKTWLTVTN